MSTTTTSINIVKFVGNKEYWSVDTDTCLTGHMHRNSPYEMADSCGTCNGANCDYCKKIVTTEVHFSVSVNILEGWLLSLDIPHDVVSELVYSDTNRRSYKGYRLLWPDEDDLKEVYPQLYDELTA